LATTFSRSKVERPIVFLDSIGIFNYIHVLNQDLNQSMRDSTNENPTWQIIAAEGYEMKYSLPSISDYQLALQRFYGIKAQLVITEGIDYEPSVPRTKMDVFDGKPIIGLIDNASELFLLDGSLFIIYLVDNSKIYATRFTQPDYHIGFRLKCKISRKEF
jgi:hypothetical protein